MIKQSLLFISLILIFCLTIQAGDLFKVRVSSESEAQQLRSTGVDAVIRLNDGFLVLADPNSSTLLQQSGLEISLVARNVDRSKLAIDLNHKQANESDNLLLFAENNVRLYSFDFDVLPQTDTGSQIVPLPPSKVPITYLESAYSSSTLLARFRTLGIGLDTMIAKISPDSLSSYVRKLQTWGPRVSGSTACNNSRYWLVGRLHAYGYDSVVLDSFTNSIYSTVKRQNILAYKMGTRFPNHRIVIGAHRDAVPSSPGADDNGSGSAAVLEIARILANVPTDLSIVFALFDGEENGLLGSYHYVEDTYKRKDTTVYMMNFDMIGFRDNTTHATMHHGPQTGFPGLWIKLADSLVGITGHLSGQSSASDHFPFSQAGIEVAYAEEYIFSSVYHTYRDSIAYLSIPYMTKLVKASMAASFIAAMVASPAPSLSFEFVGGEPTYLPPNIPISFQIKIKGVYDGVLVPGSEKINYAYGSQSYSTIQLTAVSPGTYQVVLPATTCGNKCKFYFEAREATSGIVYSKDPGKPHSPAIATASNIVFQDDFETNQGWTTSSSANHGFWERAVPALPALNGAPPSDFNGSGTCYVTENRVGTSGVMGGTVYLTSPIFDGTGYDLLFHNSIWFSAVRSGGSPSQVMTAYATNNGGASWVLFMVVGPTENINGGWHSYDVMLRNYLTPSSQMQIRYQIENSDLSSSIEAAVDDIQISTFTCGPCCEGVRGNVDLVGVDPDLSDLSTLVEYLMGSGVTLYCMEEADVDESGSIDISDLSSIVDYLTGGSFVLPNCQ